MVSIWRYKIGFSKLIWPIFYHQINYWMKQCAENFNKFTPKVWDRLLKHRWWMTDHMNTFMPFIYFLVNLLNEELMPIFIGIVVLKSASSRILLTIDRSEQLNQISSHNFVPNWWYVPILMSSYLIWCPKNKRNK